MLKIYGKDDCSRCERLKYYLNERKIPYEYILDKKELMILASKARITSAPVIVLDGKIYSFESYIELVEG